MSGAIATAYVKLIPTFDKQLKSSIEKQLGGVDGKKAGSKVGSLFTKGVDSGMSGLKTSMTSRFSAATVAIGNIAARAFTGAMSAVASSMDSAINRVDIIENFPKVMTSLGYSAEESAASMNIMKQAVDGLPTRLQDMTTNVQTLAATMGNLSDGEVNATTVGKAFNDMMLAGGQGTEAASNAFTQYTQMLAVGKVDQQAWNSVVTAAPGQMKLLAESLLGTGASANDLKDAMQAGTVTFEDFNAAVVRLDKEGGEGFESFEAQARKATKGIGTSIENAKSRVTSALAGIIQAIGQENISGVIEAFTTKFGSIGKIIGGFGENGEVVGFVAGLKRGLESAFNGWAPKLNIDWGELFGNATKVAERTGELLAKPVSTFIKSWDEGMARLGETFQISMNKLDFPEIDWDAMMDGISGVIDVLMDFNFEIISNAVFELALVASWLQDSIGPAVEKLQPTFENIGRAAQDFVAPIADFVTGHGPEFDRMMGNIKTAIEDMGPYAESLAGHINNIAEKLEPLAGPLGQLVAQSLSDAFTKAAVAANLVLRVLDKIAEHIDNITSAIKPMADAFDRVASLVSNAWGPVIGVLSQTDGLIGGIARSLNGLPVSKTINLYANDFASGVINNVLGGLRQIASSWTARVDAMVGRAAGGFYKLHASGGFITNGPTALGRDRYGTLHIAGEAGREWIKRHADGTTSIIPIENRRYLKPYAREIAGMIGGTGTVNNYNITLDYKAGDDANKIFGDFTRMVKMQSRLGA